MLFSFQRPSALQLVRAKQKASRRRGPLSSRAGRRSIVDVSFNLEPAAPSGAFWRQPTSIALIRATFRRPRASKKRAFGAGVTRQYSRDPDGSRDASQPAFPIPSGETGGTCAAPPGARPRPGDAPRHRDRRLRVALRRASHRPGPVAAGPRCARYRSGRPAERARVPPHS
jgi:hypothetical protein